MKPTISWLFLSLAMLTLAPVSGANAEIAAGPDSSWARIGVIRSDGVGHDWFVEFPPLPGRPMDSFDFDTAELEVVNGE